MVFIKYFSFPFRGNFLPNINSSYIKKCNFDFESNMYCPIFKVGDVIRFADQNFTALAKKVSVCLIIFNIWLFLLLCFYLAFFLSSSSFTYLRNSSQAQLYNSSIYKYNYTN